MCFKTSEAGEVIIAVDNVRVALYNDNKPYIQAVRSAIREYEGSVKTLAAKKVVKFLGYTPMIIPELAKLIDRLDQADMFPIHIGNETLFVDDLTTVLDDIEDTNTRG